MNADPEAQRNTANLRMSTTLCVNTGRAKAAGGHTESGSILKVNSGYSTNM